MYPIDIATRRSLGIGSAPRCCFSSSSPPPLFVRTPEGGVGVGVGVGVGSGACFSPPLVVDVIVSRICEDGGLNTNITGIPKGNCGDDHWR